MRFGPVALDQAEGAILAHSLKHERLRFKKGRILDGADIEALRMAGIASVTAAMLAPDDVTENEAAQRLADAMPLSGVTVSPAATGRVNLFAAHAGLFRADRERVDRLNRIDPAITFACLADHAVVSAGDMVATIKIIPLAVAGPALDAAVGVVADQGCVRVKPFRAMSAGLVATQLPSLKQSVMDKTADLLRQRLAVSASWLSGERRVGHEPDELGAALRESAAENDLVVVFGASAVVDANDVVPAAIRMAGGIVDQVGMPVDPGNLLVLGRIGGVPVIGAPGCARSPKENGFDWILARILADELPGPETITGMGVGGLLTEIPSRPQPRVEPGTGDGQKPIHTIVLAAGRASRMGGDSGHKLLATFNGEPLVRRTARLALDGAAGPVHVVVGYRGDAVIRALDGLPVDIVDNPAFASGMASSLAAGLNRIGGDAEGALIVLADMPGIVAGDLEKLVSAFRSTGAGAIVRAGSAGKRGNPVLFPRAAFEAMAGLSGDVGARAVIESGAFEVIDVDIGEAAHLDVDTPDAVAAAGGILENQDGSAPG